MMVTKAKVKAVAATISVFVAPVIFVWLLYIFQDYVQIVAIGIFVVLVIWFFVGLITFIYEEFYRYFKRNG
jgi:hypothetical protein